MDILIDCGNGISGDMLAGALLDLGASEKKLLTVLKSLGLGCEVRISKVEKHGLIATDFDVLVETHDHDMGYLFGNEPREIPLEVERNYFAVEKIILASAMPQGAKIKALEMFKAIATAEADAHHERFEQVVFHESGAMDSIMDISAIATLFEDLGIKHAYYMNLREGKGTIQTRKGLLPIPTPATANLAKMFGLGLERCELPFELITPTGLAAIGCLAKKSSGPHEIVKTAYGNGKRDYPTLGVLKIHQIKEKKNEEVL